MKARAFFPGLAAGSAVLAAGGSIALAAYAQYGKRQTLAEALEWQKDHYDISYIDPLKKTEYTIESYDGYVLHAMFFENPAASDKYVIFTHGYSDNRYGNLKYMKMYLELGFHCVVYDMRGHGENERTFCTYGTREGMDLFYVIADTYERYGKDIYLGLHGESCGSATTVSVLGLRQDVRFAVCDCGFADIVNVLEGGVKNMHLPAFSVKMASAAAKIWHGESFYEMRPIDALSDNRVPIMFIHGAADDFVLPSNSERMYAACKGYRELHLIEGAGHAASVLTDPVLYRSCLEAFLSRAAGADK